MSDWKFKATIKGHLVSMKNSKRIVRGRNGKPMVIKKEAALAWETAAAYQLPRPGQPYLGNVVLVGAFHYKSQLSDLDENLLMDVLEKRGILGNDRQIKGKLTVWKLDKANPRVEFELVPLEKFVASDYQDWLLGET